ncbi:MAG: chemotaxis-specific protein-glutamate methyltransferase CheB [Pseudobutyrivibrio sp.]|nr:chemotaxis-specific protein-glutamate methyltransferase CheB [Pseudobutyrivibrio sp.]
MYKILVVDDSALMRRVICDIINADNDFRVIDVSADGEDAYNKIQKTAYDLVVLDMVLPKVTGVQLLEKLYKEGIPYNVVLISSSLKEDAESTMRAMELGALDFVVKPIRSGPDTREVFGTQLLGSLHNVIKSRSFRTISPKTGGASSMVSSIGSSAGASQAATTSERMANVRSKLEGFRNGTAPTATAVEVPKPAPPPPAPAPAQAQAPKPVAEKPPVTPKGTGVRTKKIIALACSTGGPQALHTFVPMLPQNLSVPLVLVQHMPEGFTASLAARLDQISAVSVKEAEDGEYFKPGVVYVTPGGKHMKICEDASHAAFCHLDDGPPVNSLKPCADVMYRSLATSSFDEIICVVLTGMGADGSEGIRYLNQYKKTYVISQEASTCVVYGMPKAVETGGLSNEVQPLKSVANSIVKKLGGL